MNFRSLLTARTPEASKERIVAAAIQLGELVITLPPPARHKNLITVISSELGQIVGSDQEGFVTSEGRFVSGTEAREIAIAAQQADCDIGSLLSHHLW
ncbi:hypothetical protein [Brucella pituitosa]|uniref:hypothetical protein n=1 Tax=Brucella pituitosa TaxID=571256 RepID=UPI0009A1B43F|nr:hypothetical protein [Brucella pituitosa]